MTDHVIAPLSGDPETLAQVLIQDELPQTFLDEIDISTDDGKALLLSCLAARQYQASIEKDEFIRFVERNRGELERGILGIIRFLSSIAMAFEGGESFGAYFDWFATQVQHALDGRPEKIDVLSSRLMWLLCALALKLTDGSISYHDALRIINKEEHRQRIGRRALMYLIEDYAGTIGASNQLAAEYPMLITECGLLIRDPPPVRAGLMVLRLIAPPDDTAPWLELFKKGIDLLKAQGTPHQEIASFLSKAQARLGPRLPEDDF